MKDKQILEGKEKKEDLVGWVVCRFFSFHFSLSFLGSVTEQKVSDSISVAERKLVTSPSQMVAKLTVELH